MVTRAVPLNEFPSLIETIFSGRKTGVADRLGESDAQEFIDIMDEVRRFRGMVDFSFFYVLLFRHLTDPISHHVSERNA